MDQQTCAMTRRRTQAESQAGGMGHTWQGVHDGALRGHQQAKLMVFITDLELVMF